MDESDVIEGAYYRLNIQRKDYLEKWCKHDIVRAVVIDGQFIFKDTYWRNSDATRYSYDKVKDVLVFAIDGNHMKEVTRFEFDMYDDCDKLYIPIGGSSEQLLVDTRAERNRDKIIEELEWKLSRYESDERSARHNKERIQGYLDDLDSAIENGIYS